MAAPNPGSQPKPIRRVNPLKDPNWDKRIARLPGATFFHGSAWANVLHSTYRFSPSYMIEENGDQLTGLISLMEVDSWLTGRRGAGLPFTDECAPLAIDPKTISRLFAAAVEYAEQRKWAYLECRGGRSLFHDAAAATTYWGHSLELLRDENAQLARVSKSAKGVIKKAAQTDLSIETSTSMAALQEFHGLLCKTRKRHGVPPQPYVFFENIYAHVLSQNQGCVVLARINGTPAAGAVYFHSGRSAIYKFAASDEAFKSLGANNLVMWKGIRWHAENGFTEMNFGRSATTNEGLRKFKLGWGPSEYPIEYIRHDVRQGNFVVKSDESSGWHTRVFNLLPTKLSQLLGAFLYKHAA